jgi:hypothetical protein
LHLETLSRTTFLNFVDKSAENLVDKTLLFDTEFVDRQRIYLTEKKNKDNNIKVSSDRKPSPQHQLPVKPGLGGSLTGNLNFKRQLIVDNLPETPGLRVASYVVGKPKKCIT